MTRSITIGSALTGGHAKLLAIRDVVGAARGLSLTLPSMKKVVLITLLFASVLVWSPVHAELAPLKLGVLLCTTGPCAEVGSAALEGVTLAIEEINARGGILGRRITLVTENSRDGDSPSHALTAFRRLSMDSEIFYIIGPTWSPAGMPLVPLIKARSDLIVVSPSLGVRAFNEGAENILNLWPNDELGATGLARLAFRKGLKRVAIISAQDPWASDQAKHFSKEYQLMEGTALSVIEPLPSQTDLKSEILKILKSKPEAVLFTLAAHMTPGARALREQNFTGQLLSIQMNDAWVRAAHGALEGTIFTGFPEGSPKFVESFKNRFGHSPGMSADTGYDAVILLDRAAQKVKSLKPGDLVTTMLGETWEGASGRIQFDKYGGVQREPKYFQVRKEQFVDYTG